MDAPAVEPVTIAWQNLPRDRFGDLPALQDTLADLILRGIKTASCSSAAEGGDKLKVGGLFVIEDSRGKPVCVIETLTLTPVRFCDVTPAMAAAEGEGDLSLEYWRTAHRDYFSRNGGFAEDMPLIFETFRVVQVL